MKRILVGALFFAGVYCAIGAGSLVQTAVSIVPPQKVTVVWTADTNGAVSATTDPIRGELSRITFANEDPSPTNNTYAVTLKDAAGVDVLAGQGSAIPSNVVGTATQIIPGTFVSATPGITNLVTGFVVNGPLSLVVSGVGTSATAALGRKGSIVIYMK